MSIQIITPNLKEFNKVRFEKAGEGLTERRKKILTELDSKKGSLYSDKRQELAEKADLQKAIKKSKIQMAIDQRRQIKADIIKEFEDKGEPIQGRNLKKLI